MTTRQGVEVISTGAERCPMLLHLWCATNPHSRYGIAGLLRRVNCGTAIILFRNTGGFDPQLSIHNSLNEHFISLNLS